MRVCPRCHSIYATKVQWCGIDNAQLVDQPNDPLIGTELERYRIVENLGIGGMGCVYRAKHTFIDRQYAIKVLFGEFAGDPKFQERFRREAKSVSQIRHPNIVTVEDFGTTPEGLTFLAMEMVTGKTLEHTIEKEAPFSPVRAAQIIRQVVAALGAAHELGFVHRDVKPSNVMLSDREGIEFVKILDFGAVGLRSLPADQRLTSVGHIIGTPTYMAPEQSQDPSVGPPADLYAVGTILYEMLTGSPPFVGKGRAEVLIKHIMEEPPPAPPSRGLEHLIAALLRKQPERRPQTAREVINAIDELGLDIAIVTDAPQLPQSALLTTELPRRGRSESFARTPGRASTPSTNPRAATDPDDHPTPAEGPPPDLLGYDTFPALETGERSGEGSWEGTVPYGDLTSDDLGTTARRHIPGSVDDDEFASSTHREPIPGSENATDAVVPVRDLMDDLDRDTGPITDPGPDGPPVNAEAPGAAGEEAALGWGPTLVDLRYVASETTPTTIEEDDLPTGDLDPDALVAPSSPNGFEHEKTPLLDQALTVKDRHQDSLEPSISDVDSDTTVPDPSPDADSLAAATMELPAQKRPEPSRTMPLVRSTSGDYLEESEESLSMKPRVIPVVDTAHSSLRGKPDAPRSKSAQIIPWAVAVILLLGAAIAAFLLWGGHSQASERMTIEAAARPEAPLNRE